MKKLIVPAVLAVLLLSGTLLSARQKDIAKKFCSSPTNTAAAAEIANAPRSVAAEARVVTYPGEEVTVGTDLAGRVVAVPVKEKANVKKGELLVELDASEQRAALAEARARIAEADSDIRLYELEVERARSLFEKKVGAKQPLDLAERNLDASRAHRQTAAHEVERLAAVVAKSRILSPIDGVVLDRLVHPGETVDRGASLVKVANITRTRLEAEVDEFDAGRVKLGSEVTVRAEGFPGKSWRAAVEEVPDSVTGRRLKPEDPGRPSDTRVLLVKVALSEPAPLKLGQRVEVDIRTDERN